MAKKVKNLLRLSECGYDSPAFWQMPRMRQLELFKEFREVPLSSQKGSDSLIASTEQNPKKLSDIVYSRKVEDPNQIQRIEYGPWWGNSSWFGDLFAGDPGIGKSTLLLQLCLSLAQEGKTVLYISGEESVEQIKMRGGQDYCKEQRTKSKEQRARTYFLTHYYLFRYQIRIRL